MLKGSELYSPVIGLENGVAGRLESEALAPSADSEGLSGRGEGPIN
jgi:hypothetical protein